MTVYFKKMAIFNNKVKAAVVFVTVVWLLYGRKALRPKATRFRGSGTVGGGPSGGLGFGTGSFAWTEHAASMPMDVSRREALKQQAGTAGGY